MLAGEELACVRGSRSLFSGLSFAVSAGTLLRISGENGAGKTSLLRILCGLMHPAAGRVLWRGSPVGGQREEFACELRYIGHLPGIKDEFTAAENLAFAAELSGAPAAPGAVRAALDRLGVARCADIPARLLSQGQRRRVALARLALPDTAALWVLDEPLVALDAAASESVLALIDARLAAGAVVVMTSHQPFSVAAALQSISIPV